MSNITLVRLLTLSWGEGLHASDDLESCVSSSISSGRPPMLESLKVRSNALAFQVLVVCDGLATQPVKKKEVLHT